MLCSFTLLETWICILLSFLKISIIIPVENSTFPITKYYAPEEAIYLAGSPTMDCVPHHFHNHLPV